jgi:hypothetical protein
MYLCLSFLHGQHYNALYSPHARIRQVTDAPTANSGEDRVQSHYIGSVLRVVQFNMVNYYQSVRLHVAGVRA